MVLTADRGVAFVVMNTEEYDKKAEELLSQNTYRALTSDPTMRMKEQDYKFAKIHQGKGWHKRRFIQKALPHRGLDPPNSMDLQRYIRWGCH